MGSVRQMCATGMEITVVILSPVRHWAALLLQQQKHMPTISPLKLPPPQRESQAIVRLASNVVLAIVAKILNHAPIVHLVGRQMTHAMGEAIIVVILSRPTQPVRD
jgi:hypothetical protein